MPLPNPHGSASGQIAHNSIYDTGVTPGSTGGKFIGFGEEGTSYITNRANWALSENIDYVYQIIAGDRAIPAGASFTSSGQSTYQLSGDVWVGDSSYPASEEEGLLTLFAVLDEQYNELTDTSGNEVRVAIVRDSTNTTNAYKNEFETDPVVTFKTVDSSGADVQNPYTIPAAQEVRVLHGVLSSFEALPKDALVRFKLQSASEVEAGAFLQDGTKKMTGDADWNEKRILNLLEARGASGQDLLIRSLQNLNLQADQTLTLKDQNTPSVIYLGNSSAGGTEVEGYHNSLLSSLNSKSAITGSFIGNRSLDRTGSLTFTDGTATVAWPTLNVVIDGERRVIAAGSRVVTTGFYKVLVMDSSGAHQERAPEGIYSTDIPIAAYYHNGSVFSVKLDIRWAYNATSRTLKVTCGTGSGVDFNDFQLQEAIYLAGALGESAKAHPIVEIIGSAYAPPTKPEVDIYHPLTIRGGTAPRAGADGSIIRSDEANGDSTVLFDCNGQEVHFEKLTLMHAGNTQTTGLSAIRNAGDGSTFRDVYFDKDGGTYDIGFASAFSWSSAARNIVIERCSASEVTHSFLLGTSTDYATPYLTESVIRDCRLSGWGASAVVGLSVNGDGNIVQNVEISSGLNDYCIVAGNDTLIDRCKFRMSGAGGAAPAGIFYKPLGSPVYHQGLKVRDCFFLRISGSGIRADAINDTGITLRVSVRGCEFTQVDTPFAFGALAAVSSSSSLVVEGCTTSSTNEFIASINNLWHAKFDNNVHNAVGGDGYIVGLNGGITLTNNWISGFGSAGTNNNAIEIGAGAPRCHIEGNIIGMSGAPIGSTQVRLWRRCTFVNNQLIGGDTVAQSGGLQLTWVIILGGADQCTVSGNHIHGHQKFGIQLTAGANGCRIIGNTISGIAYGGFGIHVFQATNTTIEGNLFTGYGGTAFNGLGILVQDNGAGGSGEYTQIVNNHFRDVAGIDMTNLFYGVIIIRQTSGGGCADCLVSGNLFQDCGDTVDISGAAWATIDSNGIRTSVQHNMIRTLSANSSNGLAIGILLRSYVSDPIHGVIIGNTIRHNMSNGQIAQTMEGIRVQGASNYVETLVALNLIDWRGTDGSGAGFTTKAINLIVADDVVVIGNVFPDYTHTGATNLVIDASYGSSNMFVGNIKRNGYSSSIHANAKPSTATYNVNTNNPRGDFNTL